MRLFRFLLLIIHLKILFSFLILFNWLWVWLLDWLWLHLYNTSFRVYFLENYFNFLNLIAFWSNLLWWKEGFINNSNNFPFWANRIHWVAWLNFMWKTLFRYWFQRWVFAFLKFKVNILVIDFFFNFSISFKLFIY